MSGEGLSRRALLGGSVYATMGAGAIDFVARAAESAEDRGAAEASASARVVLRVNGADRALTVEPRMTLAEALRGPLGLTGTKIGCNRGACSACTVWLDGMPVCSCMTLAVDVGSRAVATIEGLATSQELHPVQVAFIEHDAMQCGFCTPGMAMSCAALLEHNPDPTPDEVQKAISGHICRCGSYPHVVAATLAAAKAREA